MNLHDYLKGYLQKSSADMASLPAPGNNLIRDPVDNHNDNKQKLKEKLNILMLADDIGPALETLQHIVKV